MQGVAIPDSGDDGEEGAADQEHHPAETNLTEISEEAAALATLLQALADKTRIAMLSAILHSPAGELHGRVLQEMLGLRQPTASHHLKKLLKAGS
jgi:DNA-binding transcriptional ArsR family regulator